MSTDLNWLDPYFYTRSGVHSMDPRIKLILTLAFVLAVTSTPFSMWPAYVAFLVLVWTSVALARLSPLRVLRRSLMGIYFATVVVISVPFTTQGTPLLSLPFWAWRLEVTDRGLMLLAGVVAKSWLSVTAATVLVSSTRFTEILQALASLRLPRVMVNIVAFTYRYIFVLVEEARNLALARDSRSADPDGRGGGTVLWRARVLGSMLASLFIRSLERSERVYQAMASRGYRGELQGFHLLAPGRGDMAKAAIALAVLAAVEAAAFWLARKGAP